MFRETDAREEKEAASELEDGSRSLESTNEEDMVEEDKLGEKRKGKKLGGREEKRRVRSRVSNLICVTRLDSDQHSVRCASNSIKARRLLINFVQRASTPNKLHRLR